MKWIVLAAALAAAPVAVAVQEVPQPAQAGAQHGWLKQLVGEWSVATELMPAPGVEPTKMEATESVRAIGDLWVVAEIETNVAGLPFTAILTLGYDPGDRVYVGTWIDSTQPHLWTYRGTLDEAQRTLTLESEGPSFADPAKLAQYRDVIEITGPASRTLTSSTLGEDGAWTTFARAEYRRKE